MLHRPVEPTAVGSLGALMMLTAFLWGWAGAWVLPSYQSPDVQISSLRKQLSEKEQEYASLESNITNVQDAQSKVVGLAERQHATLVDLEAAMRTGDKKQMFETFRELEEQSTKIRTISKESKIHLPSNTSAQ